MVDSVTGGTLIGFMLVGVGAVLLGLGLGPVGIAVVGAGFLVTIVALAFDALVERPGEGCRCERCWRVMRAVRRGTEGEEV